MAKKNKDIKIDIKAFEWHDVDTSPVENVLVTDKKALKSFFDEDETKSKELKKNDKVKKISKRKQKKQAKQQNNREKAIEQAKNQKIFKYRKKKYKTIEEFIKYLNDHYLELDEIAKELLEDKLFLGWIKRKSGVFEQSLREFKSVQYKIEKSE